MTRKCIACKGYGYYRKRTKEWCCLNKDCKLIQPMPNPVASERKHNVKKRNPAEMESIPTKDELIKRIGTLKTGRERALASFLFLSGCRITEVIGILDKTLVDEFGKPIRKNAIRSKQIEILTEPGHEGIVLIKSVWTLKRRKKPLRRDIIINIQDYPVLWNYFWDDYARAITYQEAFLFPITRARAAQIIKKIGIFCHLIRHIRLTELSNDYNFQHEDLKDFTGWRSSSSAENYIHPDREGIIRKLKRLK